MRRNRDPQPPYEEEPTRRYPGPDAPVDEAAPYRVEDGDPYDDAEPYDDAPYDEDEPYEELYDEDEYSDAHEELDDEHRLRVAMSAFDIFSVVVGCVCIFVLVTLLISLFSWLRTDIAHGLSIFNSRLQ